MDDLKLAAHLETIRVDEISETTKVQREIKVGTAMMGRKSKITGQPFFEEKNIVEVMFHIIRPDETEKAQQARFRMVYTSEVEKQQWIDDVVSDEHVAKQLRRVSNGGEWRKPTEVLDETNELSSKKA